MATCSHCNTQLSDDSLFCPRCGAPLVADADDELLASSASDPTGLLDRLRTATAGEFTIIRELGRGGMGRVYLAHEMALDRRVAMKVLPPALADHSEIVQRFQREARMAGKLSHPNIVPVYQVSERTGLYFFTMPYVAGPSLRQILGQTPQLSAELARRYLHEAADALNYAHKQGVVHRDIKPENMLMEGSRDGRLMLTDFGIAKALGTATTLTRPGDMMGTPYFMSPEQCEEGDRIDGRSDQYSLGLVGYEMLAGRFPFTADSLAGIVYKHLHDYPEPLEKVRPDLPGELRAAIERAIRKDPDERFPTMAAFLEALGTGSRTGALVRRPRVARPTQPPRRRRRRRVVLAAVAAVVALAGAAVVYQQRASSARPGGNGLSELGPPTGGKAALNVAPAGEDSTLPLASAVDTGPVKDDTADASGRQVQMAEPAQRIAREPDELQNARRDARRARDDAERARQLALDAGADSLLPDRFAEVDGRYARAQRALEAGQIVTAATTFGAATQEFGDLASEALQRAADAVEPEAGNVSGGGAGEIDEREAPDPGVSGDVSDLTPTDTEMEEEIPPERAITSLVESYRTALESEDLSRLTSEVYRGAIPSEDEEFLRLLFERGYDYAVTIEPAKLEVGEASAEMAIRQRMRYRLTRSREERSLDLSLHLFFGLSDGAWRLQRIEGYRR